MTDWTLGTPSETNPFGAPSKPPTTEWVLGQESPYNPFGPEGQIGSTAGIAARGVGTGVNEAVAGAMKGTAEVLNRRATFEPWYDVYLKFGDMDAEKQLNVYRQIQTDDKLSEGEKSYLQSQMTLRPGGKVSSLEEFAGLPTQETGLYKAGAEVERTGQLLTPAEQQTTTGQVATGIGAFAGAVGPAAIAGAAGQPELAAALAAGGVHAMAASSAADAAAKARAGGATEEQARRIASVEYGTNLALMTAPVGSFLGEVGRSAPGFLPWAGAKLRQAIQTGAVFAGIGEVQEYLTQEAAREIYDSKAQYTPDERRMLVNFLSGAVVGPFGPTAVKPSPRKVADLVGHVEPDQTVATLKAQQLFKDEHQAEALKNLDAVAQMGVDALNRGVVDQGAIAFDAAAKAGKATVPDLSDARALGVIGLGEDRATPATAEAAGAQVASAGEHVTRRPDAQKARAGAGGAPDLDAIHTVARQLDFGAFERRDELQAQHDALTRRLNDLEAEHAKAREAGEPAPQAPPVEIEQIREARAQVTAGLEEVQDRVAAAYRDAETRVAPVGATPAGTEPPASPLARIAGLQADREAEARGERVPGAPAQSFEAIAQTETARAAQVAPLAERLPKEPVRLIAWLRANGGVKDPGGEIASILGVRANRSGGLINNKSGMDLDHATLRAWEQGGPRYLEGAERPEPQALLDAIQEDRGAKPRYAGADADLVENFRAAVARNAEIERLAHDHNIQTNGLTREQFFDRVAEAMSREQQDAEIASQATAFEAEFAEAERAAKEALEARGDAWEPDEIYGEDRPRTLEDLEHERRQEEAARGPLEGGGGAQEPGPAAGREGEVQEGSGPRGPGAEPAGSAAETGLPGAVAPPIDIAADASRQLQGVGRPGAEAKAAGALVEAYYRARAARLTGTTAEDLYREQGATIRAGRGVLKAAETERALAAGNRGRTDILLGRARNVITMLKRADASTIIHESGHDWIEQLMRDAADPRATSEAKALAQDVAAWLKIKVGERIPTRAHEHFARTFEAYVWEGHAPSARLAEAFQQFASWLKTLYQTIRDIPKADLTDSSRKLFDRLLTRPEERTVIAPEREPAKTFADEHAEDARNTPRALADPAADQIEEEIDALAAQHVEWVPHEQFARKAEGEPAEAPGAPAGGAEPGPAAGGPRVPGESPALPAVGGATPAEGGGARGGAGEPNRAGAGEGGGTAGARAGREADVGAANPWLIQKAANIRMENLTDSQKVIAAAQQLAKENNDFIAERRGVVHDSELLDAAMSIGLDPDQINLRKLQQLSYEDNMSLGSRILALRILMAKAGTEDRAFAARAAADGATDEDVMAYMRSQDRLRTIARTLAGVTAEWGRAGRGFRNLAGFREAMARAKGAEETQTPAQRQLFQSELERARDRAKMVAQADTHEQAMRLERQAAQSDFQRFREKARSWYLSYLINNLISGPFTHAGYSIGNTVWNQFKITVDTSGAAAIGSFRQMMGSASAADRVYWGEVGAQLFASFRGFRDGIGFSGKALRTGIPFMKGDLEGMARRQKAEDATVAEGIARDDPRFDARVRELAAQKPIQTLPGKAGYYFETPSRLVTAIHTVFYSMNYETEIARLAYRTAAMEGHEIGGDDFNNRVATITASPERVMQNRVGKDGETEPVSLMQMAHEEALRAVLMEKPMFGSWQYSLQQAVNRNVAAKTVMPFMQIGMNILREGWIDHTPLGIVSQRVRDNMLGKNGAAARDTQIAKMGIGVGIALAVMGATAEGILTDGGPTDPERRARWLAEGKLPYSIKIGNFYVPYRKYLGPLGPLVAGASNIYTVAHLMKDSDLSTAAHATVFGFEQAIVDETWMRGVSDFIEATKSREGVISGQYFRNLASDFVPWAVGMGQVAREIDPYSRQVHSLTDALLNKIPGASMSLEPRIDIWGDPIPGRTIMSPSLNKADPTMDALDRLDFKPATLQRKIRGVELTDAQYADYGRIAGRSSKLILDQLTRQPGFGLLPPELQKKMVTKVIDDSREVARSRVMLDSGRGKYGGPETDIIQRSIAARRRLLQPQQGTAPE